MPTAPPYPSGHKLLDGKATVITAAAGTGIGFAAAKRAACSRAREVHQELAQAYARVIRGSPTTK